MGSFLVAEEEEADPPDYLTRSRRRVSAEAQFLEGNTDKTIFLPQTRDPHNPTELASLAEALANAEQGAHTYRSFVYLPTEADAISAPQPRQGKKEAAAAPKPPSSAPSRRVALIDRRTLSTVDEVAADPSTPSGSPGYFPPLPAHLNEGRPSRRCQDRYADKLGPA